MPARSKFFHLRYTSVIGCSAHGPFGRDYDPACTTCRRVRAMRSFARSGQLITLPDNSELIAWLAGL